MDTTQIPLPLAGARTVYPTTPQRVEYQLTRLGITLRQAVQPLGAWAQGHVGEILKSRERFDGKLAR